MTEETIKRKRGRPRKNTEDTKQPAKKVTTLAKQPTKKATKKKRTGRPSGYSEKLADRICLEIASGRSLRSVLQDPNMPNLAMVFRWLTKHAYFREQYEHSQFIRADRIFEDCIDIADGKTGPLHLADKTELIQNTQRDRLRIDTRKWFLSRMFPKKYGDLNRVQHSGDAENPIEINTKQTIKIGNTEIEF